jgi:hypothetical protein
LAVALLALALSAAFSVLPPRAAPASVSEDTSSAARAMRHLRIVAAEPHPIGSPAQERVRDHLVAEGEALGLPTEVRRDAASGAENVIVRMPGTANSTRDVLITAHYDSAPTAPGAADNGMAVAAMLETMRVLQAHEPLANDIVFLFTDGEERGQTGIAAFDATTRQQTASASPSHSRACPRAAERSCARPPRETPGSSGSSRRHRCPSSPTPPSSPQTATASATTSRRSHPPASSPLSS